MYRVQFGKDSIKLFKFCLHVIQLCTGAQQNNTVWWIWGKRKDVNTALSRCYAKTESARVVIVCHTWGCMVIECVRMCIGITIIDKQVLGQGFIHPGICVCGFRQFGIAFNKLLGKFYFNVRLGACRGKLARQMLNLFVTSKSNGLDTEHLAWDETKGKIFCSQCECIFCMEYALNC